MKKFLCVSDEEPTTRGLWQPSPLSQRGTAYYWVVTPETNAANLFLEGMSPLNITVLSANKIFALKLVRKNLSFWGTIF